MGVTVWPNALNMTRPNALLHNDHYVEYFHYEDASARSIAARAELHALFFQPELSLKIRLWSSLILRYK